jgi:hypothetical protein
LHSALFNSEGCTIVLPSHTYGVYEWSTPLDFHILRYWFSDPMCIKPKYVLMFLSKWKRLQKMQVPLLLLLLMLKRRFFSASKTQWIDQVFHPLLPFGATNWLSGTFSTLEFFFFKFRNLSWI